ncbi:MAG TPA: NAD(P)H-dependent glycerol-3-phosphate dehydrogenase [Candidatus Paceibacterota bacterium]|nr:NAD(P)-dependent glycerol-3-phosphate dehydrogenase [Verrucomicrobiota bacterium]HOX03393.1 NAD(P)H-dependent glycerol-3-phosphate dehydrogenase [Verrucomicrobiota bacterium]HRZ46820.1 NAD(P)H-dependent glycerol-3-phosphate dehydrogenase [Candidatus Paceibacterota bacterium]HRZ91807.1 NAD(P)H-dependent glycerol-3-phosphate dehydrogenase [Candidatus Paceibacterota bacterium]
MKIAVLGSGAWGLALGRMLRQDGHALIIWGNDPAQLEEIRQTGHHKTGLPGIELPRDWRLEPDLHRAIAEADWVVAAMPSQAFREVTRSLVEYAGGVVSATKGIELASGLTMSGVLRETAPRARIAALSGPSLALEVASGAPAAVVAASADPATALDVQRLFHRPAFRVYTSRDLVGVELGGALKNVFAIAAGVGDGLGYGDNSKAALITRAIVEMRRMGVACGAQAETFSGLSGLGDLTVTCFSRLSRNRGLGERLGRGERLEDILPTLTAVAEGYPTARAALLLARRLEVDTPIIEAVYAMLYEGKVIPRAVQDLIGRDSRPETDPAPG